MSDIRARPLFDITIELHPVQGVGATPFGERVVVPVSGGYFEGERLRGAVLRHAGSDWLLRRADGAFQQDARLTLRTDDGAIVLMSYRGVRRSSPDVAARLARGERVEPGQYYLRTAPFFETAAPRYAWLNTIVTVGIGERLPNGARYELFEIL